MRSERAAELEARLSATERDSSSRQQTAGMILGDRVRRARLSGRRAARICVPLLVAAVVPLWSCGHQDVTGQVPQVLVTVAGTTPSNRAVNVPVLLDSIDVDFRDSLTPQAIALMEFDVVAKGSAVPGRVEYQGAKAKFFPEAPLAGRTIYRCSITTGVYLVAGQLERRDYSSAFVTGDSISEAAAGAR